jgi:hypothetical protein
MIEFGWVLKAAAVVFAIRPRAVAMADNGWQRPKEIPVPQQLDPAAPIVIDLDARREERAIAKAATAPLSAPCRPSTAARLFVEWMQDHEFYGEHRWSTRNDLPGKPLGIWDMYLWYCREAQTPPIAENRFAEALSKRCKKRLIRDRSSGELRRFIAYQIPERALERVASAKTPRKKVARVADTRVARRAA